MSEAVDELMIQAQVFASAWSLVGGRFDTGHCSDDAKEAKLELEKMVRAAIAAAPAQERIDALELEVRQLTEQIAELQKPYEKGKHMTPEQHAAAIEDAVEFYLNASIGMLHFVERVDLREFAKTARQELQAAIIAGVGAAPEGWQLVPVEPTNAMLDALEEGGCSEGNYKAALAAAPQPSPTPQADSQPAPLREGEWINDAGRIKWLMWRVQDLEAKLAARAPADSVLEDAALESDYRRGYRHGYNQRDAEVRGALA